MEILPTDDQQTLADTIGRMLRERYGMETRDGLLKSELGYSDEMWGRYAELGLLGLPFGEDVGGAGMGFDEVAVVMEEFGKGLALEPYLATVVLGGGLVDEVGTDEQKQEVLSKVAEGELKLAFAGTEPGSRWSATDIDTKAEQNGDDWAVTGEKSGVLGGNTAGKYVVSAKTADGIALFLVDADAEGVVIDSYRQQDGFGAARVLFKSAKAQRLGEGDATDAIAKITDRAIAAICAEAAGAMTASLNMTVEYLKTRHQFGVAIGSFQALQHRASDMYMTLEQARSAAVMARLAVGEDGNRNDLLAAKIQIDLAARHISQESVQMHGGIGMTMEYPIGHYVKRLTVIPRSFGDIDGHIRALALAGGLISASVD